MPGLHLRERQELGRVARGIGAPVALGAQRARDDRLVALRSGTGIVAGQRDATCHREDGEDGHGAGRSSNA